MSKQQTEGQRRLNIDPDQHGSLRLDLFRQPFADLIDLLGQSGGDPRGIAVAQTKVQEAAMWADDAIFKKPRVAADAEGDD